MYTISCCRCGVMVNGYPHSNRKKRGIFKKKFKTLSELTHFWYSSNRKIFFPNIQNELTKKELEILQYKFHSIAYKNPKRIKF